eukprot:6186876-Pleurochrysis_carterae.AAC.4
MQKRAHTIMGREGVDTRMCKQEHPWSDGGIRRDTDMNQVHAHALRYGERALAAQTRHVSPPSHHRERRAWEKQR